MLRPPMKVQLPVAGSYSSALARTLLLLSNPPATSTMPLGSSVAVYSKRPVLRLPVRVQLPPEGTTGLTTGLPAACRESTAAHSSATCIAPGLIGDVILV